MAQNKRDLAMNGKAVRNCLPDEDERNDSVTPEGMALVRERMAKALAGRAFRSINDPDRVLKVG